MRRLALSLVLAASTLAPSLAQASFRDVPAGAPHARAIGVLEQLGVVSGMSDGSFRPAGGVTRAEYLKILFGSINRSTEANQFVDDPDATLPFTDVPASSWMEPFVRSAYFRDVVHGTSPTTFSPSRGVTLYEATRMLVKLEYASSASVASALVPDDEAEAKQRLGTWLSTGNLADPARFDRALTRGEVCELLYRWMVLKKTDATRYDPSLDAQLTIVSLAVPTKDVGATRNLKEALDIIESNYLRSGELHDGAMEGAISGIVDGLGDPHSAYYGEVDAEQFLNQVTGTDVGIGVFLSVERDALVIVRVLPGSPADRAGLKAGDRIVGVDGKVVADDPLAAFSYLANLSTIGQLVTLDVQHLSGGRDQLRVALAAVTQPSVEFSDLGQGLLGIRIWEFGPSTGEEFARVLAQMNPSLVKGILLDLRGNPGGLISTVVDVSAHFLPAGSAVAIISNPKGESVLTVDAKGALNGIPLVVLVDGGSASAAEILAATVRDNDRAALVGERTYGKGTVQSIIPVGSKSLLRLTVAKWLTSTGASVDGVGLTPNTVVEIPFDLQPGARDPQWEAAMDLLENLTK